MINQVLSVVPRYTINFARVYVSTAFRTTTIIQPTLENFSKLLKDSDLDSARVDILKTEKFRLEVFFEKTLVDM